MPIAEQENWCNTPKLAPIGIAYFQAFSLFNLGSSLAFVQTLSHGVYIVMNGKSFLWNNVRKNKKTGEFEELS